LSPFRQPGIDILGAKSNLPPDTNACEATAFDLALDCALGHLGFGRDLITGQQTNADLTALIRVVSIGLWCFYHCWSFPTDLGASTPDAHAHSRAACFASNRTSAVRMVQPETPSTSVTTPVLSNTMGISVITGSRL
jgi:hypothetical protein